MSRRAKHVNLKAYLKIMHTRGMQRSFFILVYTVVASATVIASRELAEPRSAYFWPVLPMLFTLYAWRDYSLT